MLECRGPGSGPCRSHLPGHRMPRLVAELVRRSPWGWRSGTVTSVSPDGWLLLECRDGQRTCHVHAWHHHDLEGQLRAGARVRLHQRGSVSGAGGAAAGAELGPAALSGPTGLVSLHVAQGPPPVPAPVDLETWAAPEGAVVIDLRTRTPLHLPAPRERG